MKIRYNSDDSQVESIKSALKSNGGFCPCALERNGDTHCMCKDFRSFVASGKTGLCHCGLYENYDESKEVQV